MPAGTAGRSGTKLIFTQHIEIKLFLYFIEKKFKKFCLSPFSSRESDLSVCPCGAVQRQCPLRPVTRNISGASAGSAAACARKGNKKLSGRI